MSSTPIDLSENRGPAIVGAVTSTWCIATIAVALRIASRRISTVGIWLDDYLIVIGTLLYTAIPAIIVYGVHIGVGQHVETVDPSVFKTLFILNFAAQLLFFWAISIIKCSILSFYWRIFHVSTIKAPIYVVAATVIAWVIASTFGTIFQCVPPKKVWDVTSPGHCFSLHTFFLATAIPEVITDFVILAMPAPYIWRLQTKLRQKIVLTIIFVIGGLACVSSIIRLWAFVARDYASSDFTYGTVNPAIWGSVEVSIAVTCACLPSIKPAFSGSRRWYAKHKPERLTSESSSPSNLFHRRLISRRSGDQVLRQSTGEKRDFSLEKYYPDKPVREWRLSLDPVPPLISPSSQPDAPCSTGIRIDSTI